MNNERITIEGKLKVKALLKERGLMMKDLAERLGIARESLTRAIQGNPTYSTLKAIADELEVDVPDLFKPKTIEESKITSVYGFLKVNENISEIKSMTDLYVLINNSELK